MLNFDQVEWLDDAGPLSAVVYNFLGASYLTCVPFPIENPVFKGLLEQTFLLNSLCLIFLILLGVSKCSKRILSLQLRRIR
jgi:hypothetical protein